MFSKLDLLAKPNRSCDAPHNIHTVGFGVVAMVLYTISLRGLVVTGVIKVLFFFISYAIYYIC